MLRIDETAHAKINLALHVTGQRPDGYHLLDTLVTFADVGDRLLLEPAAEDALTLSGRFGEGLAATALSDNLVIRARDALRHSLRDMGVDTPPVHIHLEKNLPVSSGIGGGSADAAACLRGLMRLWKARPDVGALEKIALSLGADVPMCLVSKPLVARGIGEEIEPISLPALPLLLVNPLKPVSTPAIFRLLVNKTNPPMPPVSLDSLGIMRNDLQPAAERLEPSITHVLRSLGKFAPLVARMSGSGATCFGIFQDKQCLDVATEAIRANRPDWYVQDCMTLE